ncbi:hypothetical protein [Hymenobacter negativus]|uniref:Uncharacterized protein n=1 Tax=Hymenobacter negativus TaxID=2795026 RepID=A0ABS3QME7_9BACT|nr:hypothetical protein [Hymenobacter negativus]MBO2012434.1 hypothetical protein [Hymenobacter negativus]
MKRFFAFLRSWQVVSVIFLILKGPVVQAQAPVWQMATSAAGDFSVVYAAEVDAAGNVFLTGIFQGTVSFGTTTLTSAGNYDVYVAKWSTTSQRFV